MFYKILVAVLVEIRKMITITQQTVNKVKHVSTLCFLKYDIDIKKKYLQKHACVIRSCIQKPVLQNFSFLQHKKNIYNSPGASDINCGNEIFLCKSIFKNHTKKIS